MIAPRRGASWESDLGLVVPDQIRRNVTLTDVDDRYVLNLTSHPDFKALYEQATQFKLSFVIQHLTVDPVNELIRIETRDRTFAVGSAQPIETLGYLPAQLWQDPPERSRRYAPLLHRVGAMAREIGSELWIGERPYPEKPD